MRHSYVPMSEERYFATGTEAAFELERLGHMQKMCNPITFRRLQAIGVQRGWRCLEVGAGEGSVARWLAQQVGLDGQVVATDVNTRFLRDLNLPNVEVRTHHIVDEELERGRYDLVHCRAVLGHLPEHGQALARMVAAVRPGGWICIEEGDYGAWSAVDWESAVGEQFTRAFRAALAGLHKKGIMNPYFGRLTPGLLGRYGLVDRGHQGNTEICYGGEAGARFHWMALSVLRQAFVAAGVLSEEDLAALERAFADPSFAFIGVNLFGAWGRRPGGEC